MIVVEYETQLSYGLRFLRVTSSVTWSRPDFDQRKCGQFCLVFAIFTEILQEYQYFENHPVKSDENVLQYMSPKVFGILCAYKCWFHMILLMSVPIEQALLFMDRRYFGIFDIFFYLLNGNKSIIIIIIAFFVYLKWSILTTGCSAFLF